MDRSIVPSFVIPDQFEIQEANKFNFSSGVECHYINAGDQELIKVEFQFTAGNQSDSGTFASLFTAKLLPEGTVNRTSEDIAEAIAFHGAYLDVSSGNEKLIVDVYVLNKHLDRVLDVVLDVFTDPIFGEQEVERIKDIQTQNLAVSLEKTSFLASKEFKKQVFPNHYYSNSLSEKEIGEITSDKLKTYFGNQLRGQKFKVFLSGHITDEVLSLVDKKLSTLKFNQNETKDTPQLVSVHQSGNYRVDKEGALQASVRYGFQTIKKTHPDFIKLSFVNELLGGYFGSRLMSNIREEKGFTYGIGSYLTQLKHASFFQILTDVKAESASQTVNEIKKEIDRLKNEQVSIEEIEKVRNYQFGSLASSINTPFDLMDKFKSIHFFDLNYDYFHQYLEGMKQITPQDIQETANEYLSTEPVIVVCG